MAAGRLGMFCEARLSETTKQGKPKYSLTALLADYQEIGGKRYNTDFDRFPLEVA